MRETPTQPFLPASRKRKADQEYAAPHGFPLLSRLLPVRDGVEMKLLNLGLLLTMPLSAPEFFAFDNGLTDLESPAQQASLLDELGFAGMSGRPGNHAAIIDAFDQQGLKLFATYVVLRADAESCPIPADLEAEIRKLEGRDTVLWLNVSGRSTDEVVVPAIQQICDLGAELGLKVVLYPHVNSHTDVVTSCLRLIELADRDNLGLSFNLCHFLKQNDPADLEKTIRAAAPHLWLASIHGADTGDTQEMGWDRLIQPLGDGTFPVNKVMNLFEEIGYTGPIGLQCYAIKQPAAVHLTRSMAAWRQLQR